MLEKFARDPDSRVRTEVLKKSPSDSPLMLSFIDDLDPDLVSMLAFRVGDSGSIMQEVLTIMRRLTQYPDINIRADLARGNENLPESIANILAIDPHTDVRWALVDGFMLQDMHGKPRKYRNTLVLRMFQDPLNSDIKHFIIARNFMNPDLAKLAASDPEIRYMVLMNKNLPQSLRNKLKNDPAVMSIETREKANLIARYRNFKDKLNTIDTHKRLDGGEIITKRSILTNEQSMTNTVSITTVLKLIIQDMNSIGLQKYLDPEDRDQKSQKNPG